MSARRKARCVLAAALLLAIGCHEADPERAEELAAPALPECPDPTPREALRVETLAEGLEVPWDLGFAPDGRIFVTERPGRIRVIENGRLREEPWAVLDVFAGNEAGLMGLALDPGFAENRHVYVVGTFLAAPSAGLARLVDRALRRVIALVSPGAASIFANRVVRLEDRGGFGTRARVIIDDLPGAQLHTGAALAFGPDGALFVTTGEAEQPSAAQDPDALEGKLLRYQKDGSLPDDNPRPGSPVYALGFRNPQALAWDPVSGTLFGVEHGPSGLPAEAGRSGDDELNAIAAGANHGWPRVAGSGRGGGVAWPVTSWTPAIAPAGIAVYRGGRLPWNGNLLIGALRGTGLRRLALERVPSEEPAWRARCEETLFAAELGRVRGVRVGPDGFVYLTTSNRDGRGGLPPAGDDRVLRIGPRAPGV